MSTTAEPKGGPKSPYGRRKTLRDRQDGYLVRGQDPLHLAMPHLMPRRTDNEAVLEDEIDAGPMLDYLSERNAANPEHKFTMFHIVLAALAKVLKLRPSMNRFYQGRRLYQRDHISFSFVAKQKFEDGANEALLILRCREDEEAGSLIDQIHDGICRKVDKVRKEFKEDPATKDLRLVTSLPRFLTVFAFWLCRRLDYHGLYPRSMWTTDPQFTSVFVTNLGSIKMNANYHHLSNWGTNSVFVVLGEMRKRPVFQEDGGFQMRTTLPVSFTIDERIADGLYFAKSIRLFKRILAEPRLLERPLDEEIGFD